MSGVWLVDKWVERKAQGLTKKFYPTALLQDIELPLNVVFQRLLELASDRKLILQFEIRCPNYSCVRTIDTFTTTPKQSEYTCLCGEDIEVTPDILFPVFEFTDEFKQYARSIRREDVKKKSSHTKPGVSEIPLSHNGLFTPESLAILAQINPEIARIIRPEIHLHYTEKSETHLTHNDNGPKYSIEKIEASHSSLQVGDYGNATTINMNPENVDKAKDQLLQVIKQTEIPEEQKQELQETIETVTNQVQSGKRNRTMLTALLEGVNKTIDTINKTPALINAYQAWEKFITPFLA